jgi:hypothetical protein
VREAVELVELVERVFVGVERLDERRFLEEEGE